MQQFESFIKAGVGVIGSWSIGNCEGVDYCICNNTTGLRTTGVKMVAKTPGSLGVEATSQDIDHYWVTDGDEGCAWDMGEGSTGYLPFPLPAVNTNVPGTTLFTGVPVAVGPGAVGCEVWIDDSYELAKGYVHVFEITLVAAPADSVPMIISWDITRFTGSLKAADGTNIDVTPKHLKVRIEGPGGSKAEAGPYHGWTGSVSWDGGWAGGGSWDECSQVQIFLELMPGTLPKPFGMTSVYVNDPKCGTHSLSSVSPGKSITVPCPGPGGGPEIELCYCQPDMPYVCPGCCNVLQARVCPLTESIEWDVSAPGAEGWVNSLPGPSGIGICVDSNFPPSGEFNINVTGTLASFPGQTIQKTLTVWNPSPSWPCEGGPGNCDPDLTPWECNWLILNPLCAIHLPTIRDNGLAWAGNYFPEECNGGVDCTVGNAFLHAYVNCQMTKNCSAGAAEEFWDLHEKKCPIQTSCNRSIMDLHNNSAGRAAADPFNPCSQTVWNALLDGNLIWSNKQGCCNCSIPSWTSDYSSVGQCPEVTSCGQ